MPNRSNRSAVPMEVLWWVTYTKTVSILWKKQVQVVVRPVISRRYAKIEGREL